jgi:hypothetical protein
MKYSREEKAKRLEDWKQSGKSPWVYAKENGIKLQAFTKWTKKQERPGVVQIPSASRPGIPGTPDKILIEKGK